MSKIIDRAIFNKGRNSNKKNRSIELPRFLSKPVNIISYNIKNPEFIKQKEKEKDIYNTTEFDKEILDNIESKY